MVEAAKATKVTARATAIAAGGSLLAALVAVVATFVSASFSEETLDLERAPVLLVHCPVPDVRTPDYIIGVDEHVTFRESGPANRFYHVQSIDSFTTCAATKRWASPRTANRDSLSSLFWQ